MKRILKYKLPRDGETITINAHVDRWLDIQEQNGWPHIWAVVDESGYPYQYEIVAWGTGWDYPDELDSCEYLGTAQDGLGYVWHYFMREVAFVTGTTVVMEEDNLYDYKLSTTGMSVEPYSVTISCGNPSGITVNNSNVSTIDYTIAEQLLKAVEGVRSTTAMSVHA